MGFTEAWEIAKNIPGWYMENEARLLYDSACQSSTGIGFIEVGCYAGRSTRVLAEAAKQSGSILWVIDRFQHPLPGVKDPKALVTAFLIESGCEYQIIHSTVAEMPDHAAPYLVDFIHIDDSHDAHDLGIDHIKILPRLRYGGIVCFHDYAPDFQDVVSFVNGISDEYYELGRAGECIALEKK